MRGVRSYLDCEKVYFERYIFKLFGILGGLIVLLGLSFVLYRVFILLSIIEFFEYRCNYFCSILNSGCFKYDVKVFKIFFLF